VVDRALEVQALSQRGFEVFYRTRRSAVLRESDGRSGGRGGFGKDVCALDPAVLTSDELWGETVLVGTVWDRTAGEEGADDGEVAVGGGKVERG